MMYAINVLKAKIAEHEKAIEMLTTGRNDSPDTKVFIDNDIENHHRSINQLENAIKILVWSK